MADKAQHYNCYESNFNQRETIETIEGIGAGFPFCIGNAIKYLDRAGKKPDNPITGDLEKAYWYLERAMFDNKPIAVDSGEWTALENCRSYLAEFNLKKARAYMQIYIDAVQYR